MTENVTVERTIAASPESVWAMVADVTRMGDWSPETTGCDWTRGDGPAVGARFRGRNSAGSRSWSTTCEVVACEPGREFTFEARVGLIKVARWSYTFEPAGEGCRVTESWLDQRGVLAKTLAGPVSGVTDRAEHNRQGMETTLERLASAAEAAD